MIGIIGACCCWVVIGCECGIMLINHAKGGLIWIDQGGRFALIHHVAFLNQFLL